MKRSEKRILTTHVGSIVRPSALIEQLNAGNGSPAGISKYEGLLNKAVADVVRRQVDVGLDVVNDGEYGKESWANYILKRMTGFEIRPTERRQIEWLGGDHERFADIVPLELPLAVDGVPTEACTSAITYSGHVAIGQAVNALKAALSAVEVEEAFMTAVAPASTAYDGVNEFYGTEREYIFAIADALRQEYQHIYRAGVLLQVDDAVLANMYDHLVRRSPAHYRHWAELRVEALNYALEGIPRDRVRYHVCFGSWHLPHISDAPLEEIADLILAVNAGAYSIEAANPRHEHEWRVWAKRQWPEDRLLIPGVITHHTMTVEHPRLVADRIIRMARLIGRENVIAGADCGFAQVYSIQRVHPAVMWAKFESLVAGARLASAELWGRRAD